MTLEGAPWEYCPRQVLRRSLDRLKAETGLKLLAAFEQEFIYSGVAAHPAQPYELDAYRRQGLFGETLLAALRHAGVVPDSFLSEFGPQQFEVTVAPAVGLRAADDAVITRELAQAVAFRMGHRASFSPLPEPSAASNGTHIHWSFLDEDDQPVLYDEKRPWNLSALGSQFVDGIRHRWTIDSQKRQPLPDSLENALQLLQSSESAAQWLGAEVLAAYVRFKRAEIKSLENFDESEICRRYAEVY